MPEPSHPGFIWLMRPACLHAWLSRLLLLVATVVLIANSVTQNIWTWDRFLHGGHDFETNVLLILAALCLVLVLAQRTQRNAILRVAVLLWRFLSLPCSATGQQEPTGLARIDRGARPPQPACNLPLLI